MKNSELTKCPEDNFDAKTCPDCSSRKSLIYISSLVIFAVIPALLVAVFIIVIDPHYLFRTPSLEGINDNKPFYEFQVTKVKPYQVKYIQPEAISLGSSRVEVGINPEHPAWENLNVFNAAIPSSTSYEVMLGI